MVKATKFFRKLFITLRFVVSCQYFSGCFCQIPEYPKEDPKLLFRRDKLDRDRNISYLNFFFSFKKNAVYFRIIICGEIFLKIN